MQTKSSAHKQEFSHTAAPCRREVWDHWITTDTSQVWEQKCATGSAVTVLLLPWNGELRMSLQVLCAEVSDYKIFQWFIEMKGTNYADLEFINQLKSFPVHLRPTGNKSLSCHKHLHTQLRQGFSRKGRIDHCGQHIYLWNGLFLSRQTWHRGTEGWQRLMHSGFFFLHYFSIWRSSNSPPAIHGSAVWTLWKLEKINSFGGCFPLPYTQRGRYTLGFWKHLSSSFFCAGGQNNVAHSAKQKSCCRPRPAATGEINRYDNEVIGKNTASVPTGYFEC